MLCSLFNANNNGDVCTFSSVSTFRIALSTIKLLQSIKLTTGQSVYIEIKHGWDVVLFFGHGALATGHYKQGRTTK